MAAERRARTRCSTAGAAVLKEQLPFLGRLQHDLLLIPGEGAQRYGEKKDGESGGG
jgi:hypothetical protein